jgi:hypothetical protein
MSSARALANHHLYLARLVLGAWQRERVAEQVPPTTLDAAFAPGCHAHLVAAYGWFLLAIVAADDSPGPPPSRVAELPPQPAGKAVPAEIREFEQLERGGWLAALLAWQPAPPGQTAPRRPDNLARPVAAAAGPAEFAAWADALDAAMQRMSDSLDEY